MGAYKDRQGNHYKHDATPDTMIRFFYGTFVGRCMLEHMIMPGFSEFMRVVLSSRFSALFIDPFKRKYKISLKDYKARRYRSFNAFFTREIKPEKRPICMDDNILISPCDGRLTIYDISDRLVVPIKNSEYSVKALLRNREIAEEFYGGYCVVIRLTVDDYHRYCYCDDGYKSDDMFLPGFLHTVSPLVMDEYSIFSENQRVYTVIDSEHFGRLVQIEVGALGVGRIENHDGEGEIRRGAEKGYFAFGGSTIVLLLKKDSFIPDADLVRNTADGYETIVKYGERIGCNEKYQG